MVELSPEINAQKHFAIKDNVKITNSSYRYSWTLTKDLSSWYATQLVCMHLIKALSSASLEGVLTSGIKDLDFFGLLVDLDEDHELWESDGALVVGVCRFDQVFNIVLDDEFFGQGFQ